MMLTLKWLFQVDRGGGGCAGGCGGGGGSSTIHVCTRGGFADALILLKRHTRINLNPGHIIFFFVSYYCTFFL